MASVFVSADASSRRFASIVVPVPPVPVCEIVLLLIVTSVLPTISLRAIAISSEIGAAIMPQFRTRSGLNAVVLMRLSALTDSSVPAVI